MNYSIDFSIHMTQRDQLIFLKNIKDVFEYMWEYNESQITKYVMIYYVLKSPKTLC